MLTKKQAARILIDMKPLSEMLQEWREGVKLTKAAAARRCGVSFQHWYYLESGQRTALEGRTFQKLAAGTGIPIERLMAAADYR